MRRRAFGWLAVIACTTIAVLASVARADDVGDQCPARGVSWTAGTLQPCIDDVTTRINQAAPRSPAKAALLAQRAKLRASLASLAPSNDAVARGPEFDAAHADYSAALAITPRDTSIRYERAQLLMRMDRGKEALRDTDALVAQEPTSVTFQAVKGHALSLLKRHEDAIQVYSHATQLAQSCAEASAIQRKANEFRHAFDPPPTKEEILKMIEGSSRPPLYDIPEPSLAALGFPCTPTKANSFEDLVLMKVILFESRGDSYRAAGNNWAALRDLKYALSISPTPALASLSLCALEVEMQLTYSAVETCRRAFDFNSYGMLGDTARMAKIGRFLLEDGDLKGACRIAFPFALHESTSAYIDHPDIKALRQRIKGALQGAGLTRCEADFGASQPRD